MPFLATNSSPTTELELYPLEVRLCQARNLPERKNLRTCRSEAKGTWGKRKPVSRRKKNPNCPAWVEKHASPGKARRTRTVPAELLEFLVADIPAVIRCDDACGPVFFGSIVFLRRSRTEDNYDLDDTRFG
jgi:hypothetical protein